MIDDDPAATSSPNILQTNLFGARKIYPHTPTLPHFQRSTTFGELHWSMDKEHVHGHSLIESSIWKHCYQRGI